MWRRPGSCRAPSSRARISRVDNLDVEGFLDDDALTAEDLSAGLFDGARIDIFLVNWADLAQGRLLLRRGWLGEIKRADSRFSAEIRGIANRLQQSAGKLYSRLCRTDLGSAECKVALAPLIDTLAVTAVASGDSFTVGTGRPTGFYTFGVCTFLSGANVGAATEILQLNGQAIQLFTPMPRPMAVATRCGWSLPRRTPRPNPRRSPKRTTPCGSRWRPATSCSAGGGRSMPSS
ncbi:DUF2163 domain-containing protein [Rhodoplanes elegans]|uniref:DUF2163 domain-containing protein n=1 Tax=Rhodoplanes elegans TaxID=29408 RepID=UPI001FE194DE|nr:DUF2163 domain-containing protein [Rhodoplanes elegans]